MNIIDIIDKKRLKKELSKEEIDYVVTNFIDGNIKDYQMSSLLMAITINGMNFSETLHLTDAMLKSGDILDLSNVSGVVVDKHSTGGVGDKVTFILSPLLASLGIKVAKMSGRSLGYTGGTIDKLESIKGFNVSLSDDEFINQVNDISIAVSGATKNLAPADKKIYALRDVTGTVSSIPLIASSIMSKKLASNADIIVIDVKVGSGALIKTKKEAIKLARTLIDIGKHYNKDVYCLLTNMSQPLGLAIGNTLEVKEAIDALKGSGCKDLMEVVYAIASTVISKVKNISLTDAFKLAYENISNNKAYLKFLEFVNAQGGDINLEESKNILSIISDKDGYINNIDAYIVAKTCLLIGGLRENKEDEIDYSVGVVLNKKVGDYVKKGDVLARIYYNSFTPDVELFKSSFDIADEKINNEPTIYGLIGM